MRCVSLHGMGKDMGERFSRIAGIDPDEWPVLAAVFDHTVWIKARTWQAEQIEKARLGDGAGPSASATKGWLEGMRAEIREKHAEKIERLRANAS